MAQNSALMKLPTELRDEIYRVVLVREEGIHVDNLSARKYTSRLPELLSTCRQIRHEALPIYFGENTFTLVYRGNDSRSWLAMISYRHATLLKRVCVDFIPRLKGSEDRPLMPISRHDETLLYVKSGSEHAGADLAVFLTGMDVDLAAIQVDVPSKVKSGWDVHRMAFRRGFQRALGNL